MSPNLKAFLDLIAWSEGTSTIPQSDDGYNVLVSGEVPFEAEARVIDLPNGRHLFTGYGDHPNIAVAVNSKGLVSTAAGRYQQMHHDWPVYKARLGLEDFGPKAQDALAVQHIRECHALDDIEAGDAETTIRKCNGIWASFPGNSYGQAQRPIAELLMKYVELGGTIA